MSLKFKSNVLIHQYAELANENRPLLDLIIDLSFFVEEELNKNIMITHLMRTDEQQDYFYKDNEKYKKKAWKSPHQFGHAFDLRVSTFSKKEYTTIVAYLNNKYNESNYYPYTAKVHDIGAGNHFHVQYYRK